MSHGCVIHLLTHLLEETKALLPQYRPFCLKTFLLRILMAHLQMGK